MKTKVTPEIKYLIAQIKLKLVSIDETCMALRTSNKTLCNIQYGHVKKTDTELYNRILAQAQKLGITYMSDDETLDNDLILTDKMGAIGDDPSDHESDQEYIPADESENGFNDSLFQALITAWNNITTHADRCGLVALAFQLAADSKEVKK